MKRGLVFIYPNRFMNPAGILQTFRKAEDRCTRKKIGIWQCPGYEMDEGLEVVQISS